MDLWPVQLHNVYSVRIGGINTSPEPRNARGSLNQ